MTLDLYKPDNKEELLKDVAEPCCKGYCESGDIKVYSVDHIFDMCGEGCIPSDKFNLYKLFESGLTKANVEHPCAATPAPYKDVHNEGHFSVYKKTVTHGVKQFNVTLDLYTPDHINELE